jgi:hypothetical protein
VILKAHETKVKNLGIARVPGVYMAVHAVKGCKAGKSLHSENKRRNAGIAKNKKVRRRAARNRKHIIPEQGGTWNMRDVKKFMSQIFEAGGEKSITRPNDSGHFLVSDIIFIQLILQ